MWNSGTAGTDSNGDRFWNPELGSNWNSNHRTARKLAGQRRSTGFSNLQFQIRTSVSPLVRFQPFLGSPFKFRFPVRSPIPAVPEFYIQNPIPDSESDSSHS